MAETSAATGANSEVVPGVFVERPFTISEAPAEAQKPASPTVPPTPEAPPPVTPVVEKVSGILVAKEPTQEEKEKAGYFVGENTGNTDQVTNYYTGEEQLRERAEKKPLVYNELPPVDMTTAPEVTTVANAQDVINAASKGEEYKASAVSDAVAAERVATSAKSAAEVPYPLNAADANDPVIKMMKDAAEKEAAAKAAEGAKPTEEKRHLDYILDSLDKEYYAKNPPKTPTQGQESQKAYMDYIVPNTPVNGGGGAPAAEKAQPSVAVPGIEMVKATVSPAPEAAKVTTPATPAPEIPTSTPSEDKFGLPILNKAEDSVLVEEEKGMGTVAVDKAVGAKTEELTDKEKDLKAKENVESELGTTQDLSDEEKKTIMDKKTADDAKAAEAEVKTKPDADDKTKAEAREKAEKARAEGRIDLESDPELAEILRKASEKDGLTDEERYKIVEKYLLGKTGLHPKMNELGGDDEYLYESTALNKDSRVTDKYGKPIKFQLHYINRPKLTADGVISPQGGGKPSRLRFLAEYDITKPTKSGNEAPAPQSTPEPSPTGATNPAETPGKKAPHETLESAVDTKKADKEAKKKAETERKAAEKRDKEVENAAKKRADAEKKTAKAEKDAVEKRARAASKKANVEKKKVKNKADAARRAESMERFKGTLSGVKDSIGDRLKSLQENIKVKIKRHEEAGTERLHRFQDGEDERLMRLQENAERVAREAKAKVAEVKREYVDKAVEAVARFGKKVGSGTMKALNIGMDKIYDFDDKAAEINYKIGDAAWNKAAELGGKGVNALKIAADIATYPPEIAATAVLGAGEFAQDSFEKAYDGLQQMRVNSHDKAASKLERNRLDQWTKDREQGKEINPNLNQNVQNEINQLREKATSIRKAAVTHREKTKGMNVFRRAGNFLFGAKAPSIDYKTPFGT